MKPFDLEKALAGEKLVTRDKYPVRFAKKAQGPHGEVIVAQTKRSGRWHTHYFFEDGKFFRSPKLFTGIDLFMAE